MTLDDVMLTVIAGLAPFALHHGALNGVALRPARTASPAERALFRWLPALLVLNGALLACAIGLLRLASPWWPMPLALAVPPLVLQVSAAAIAIGRHAAGRSVSRRSRRA